MYYKADGTNKTFNFAFQYIKKNFVIVSILDAQRVSQELVYPVDYTVDGNSVTLTTAPDNTKTVCVFRRTTTDRIIEWNDGSVLQASDMTISDIQRLHIIEEFQDVIYGSEHDISGAASDVKILLSDVNTKLDVITARLTETTNKTEEINKKTSATFAEFTAASAAALDNIKVNENNAVKHVVDTGATIVTTMESNLAKSESFTKDAASSAATAFAASAPAWDSTKTYKYPDVVTYTDGMAYRCVDTNVTGTQIPGKSSAWVSLTLDTDNFWEVRVDGTVMPAKYPVYSKSWELNSNGDIVPKGEDN